jgi:hypothetical protein
MPVLQEERFIILMLNPHVQKLEASTSLLILRANGNRYGRMIRKGTWNAEVHMD